MVLHQNRKSTLRYSHTHTDTHTHTHRHTHTLSTSTSPPPPADHRPHRHDEEQRRRSVLIQDRLQRCLVRTALIARKRNSFEQLIQPGVKLEHVSDGGMKAEFCLHVTQEMCHYEGILHSGVTAALVTNLTGLHASCLDPQRRIIMTVDLNVTFVNSSSVGDTVHVVTHVMKLGQRCCLAEAHLYRHTTQVKEQLAAGRHTMLFSGPAGQAAAYQGDEASENGCDFM
eukprot:GHVQ01010658.1.p1 GENE.GHVQ01010658.1~~GHVQ01010658.1.p1  ORF type:complete len:227 (-),score=33.14 GHVQ01010658.1:116-796(-)